VDAYRLHDAPVYAVRLCTAGLWLVYAPSDDPLTPAVVCLLAAVSTYSKVM